MLRGSFQDAGFNGPVVGAFLCGLLALNGCDRGRARVVSPSTSSASIQGIGNVTHLVWEQDGLTITLIDQMDVHALSETSGSTVPFYQCSGVATAGDGSSYDWEVEAKDGKTAKLTISGKHHDLNKGRVFTIVVDDQGVVVHQTQVAVPVGEPSSDEWLVFFQSHPEVIAPIVAETSRMEAGPE